jgi:hypothetical protein
LLARGALDHWQVDEPHIDPRVEQHALPRLYTSAGVIPTAPQGATPSTITNRKPRFAFSMSKARALLALAIIQLSINRFNGIARD